MHSDKNEFSGKVALVTGGSRGIGSAIVEKLSRVGASVIINHSSDKGKGASLAKALKIKLQNNGVRAEEFVADISVKREIEKMFEFVKITFGRIDILVLNAANTVFKDFEDMTKLDWDIVINTNLMGNINCVREALPLMSEGGNIITISSLGSRAPLRGYMLGPMKAALENFTRLWALEFAERGIRANSVCGGIVNSDSLSVIKTLFPFFERIKEFVIQPEEIASVVAFLCSQGANAITGEVIIVDKGLSYRQSV